MALLVSPYPGLFDSATEYTTHPGAILFAYPACQSACPPAIRPQRPPLTTARLDVKSRAGVIIAVVVIDHEGWPWHLRSGRELPLAILSHCKVGDFWGLRWDEFGPPNQVPSQIRRHSRMDGGKEPTGYSELPGSVPDDDFHNKSDATLHLFLHQFVRT